MTVVQRTTTEVFTKPRRNVARFSYFPDGAYGPQFAFASYGLGVAVDRRCHTI
jgi:hypothetical protein